MYHLEVLDSVWGGIVLIGGGVVLFADGIEGHELGCDIRVLPNIQLLQIADRGRCGYKEDAIHSVRWKT